MTLLVEIGGFELEERGNIHIKGKGQMKTYWLMGEDASRRQQRMQRGIARIERSTSMRRRNKTMDLSAIQTHGTVPEPSPQISHQTTYSTCSSSGKYKNDSQIVRNSHHLHPFSLLIGPTSHDLIRRSSSRRRQMRFHSSKGEKGLHHNNDENDLEPLHFSSDSLPTIIRAKSDKDQMEDKPEEVSHTNDIVDKTTINTYQSAVRHNSDVESIESLSSKKAPIVKIESFDCDGCKYSPKRTFVGYSSCSTTSHCNTCTQGDTISNCAQNLRTMCEDISNSDSKEDLHSEENVPCLHHSITMPCVDLCGEVNHSPEQSCVENEHYGPDFSCDIEELAMYSRFPTDKSMVCSNDTPLQGSSFVYILPTDIKEDAEQMMNPEAMPLLSGHDHDYMKRFDENDENI